MILYNFPKSYVLNLAVCRQVFSEDMSGDMTFSDFLDMLSVMSNQAPKDLKAAYAFKVSTLLIKIMGIFIAYNGSVYLRGQKYVKIEILEVVMLLNFMTIR